MTVAEHVDVDTVLRVDGLSVEYRRGRTRTRAVDDVSLHVGAGETVGVVGESGSGKTSLSRAVLGLVQPAAGTVTIAGQTVGRARDRRLLASRLQIVFQDPYSSLDPAQTVGAVLAEPLLHERLPRAEIARRVDDALQAVGLDPSAAHRYPRAFSGGQRQRIAVARAVMRRPRLVICDEPVSALDLSVQAQIVNLLMDLQETMGLSYLFIAHDLSVVRHMCRRVYVMYRGRIVESGATENVYDRPAHPYTRALLAAAPVPDPALQQARRAEWAQGIVRGAAASGAVPGPDGGCAFAARCPHAIEVCRSRRPEVQARLDGGSVLCHRYPELAQQ
jgi:peptide/nickel transport system ATP-binding protein